MRLVVAALIVLVCVSAARAADRVEKITIEYARGGNGVLRRDALVFERHGDVFVSTTSKVPASTIDELVAHVLAPPAGIDLERLGYTKERLHAYVLDWIYQGQPIPLAMARELFDGRRLAKRYDDNVFIDMEGHGESHVAISFVTPGGLRVRASSALQRPFGLPWVIDEGARHVVTYDPEISRQLAQLDASVRFLGNDGFDDLMLGVATEYGRELVVDRAPPALRVGTADSAYVGPLYGLDPRGERAWTGDVSAKAWGDVAFDLVLTVEGDQLHSPKSFDEDAPKLARRALRLPHTKSVRIHYQDDAPLTEPAKIDILDAIRRQAPRSFAKIASQLDHAFAAAIDKALYIVLPDDTYFCFYGACALPIGQLVPLPH